MIDPLSWTPAGGLRLEPNGLAAATALAESVVLTAGPGSGKTEVLAQRCDFLLRTDVCPYPRRILAISAKRDARANLANRVRERCGVGLASRLDSYTFHAFSKSIIDRFRPVLTGGDALPSNYKVGSTRVRGSQIRYADMVPLATKILRTSPPALRALRSTYSHVLLDEFQDCTGDQYELLEVAFSGTSTILTAVGDTKQRIMRWAGALDGVFRKLEDDFGATALNLYVNRRSKVRLRRMQNAMVKVMERSAALDDDDLRGEEGVAYHLRFESEVDEAAYLAEMMGDWIDREGIRPSRIAVLVSKQPDLYAKELFANLARHRIPHRDEQSLQDLAKEPLFQLLNDYLRVVFGARHPKEYTRLLQSLIETEVSEAEEFRQRDLWSRYFERIANEVEGMPLAAKINHATSAFLKELSVDFLRSLSSEYAHGNFFDDKLEECIANIRVATSGASNLAEALDGLDREESVRVLTIHKSKGLEFHSVVILGVEAETFWGDRDDERSAFFVGISRAEERLVLTTANHRSRPPAAWKWDVTRTPHAEFLHYLHSTQG